MSGRPLSEKTTSLAVSCGRGYGLPGRALALRRSFTSLAFALLAGGVPVDKLYSMGIDRAFIREPQGAKGGRYGGVIEQSVGGLSLADLDQTISEQFASPHVEDR